MSARMTPCKYSASSIVLYARCLEASFQVIYRCQKGVPTAQNINFVVISFLIMVLTIEFISHLVSCLSAIGGVIFSRT